MTPGKFDIDTAREMLGDDLARNIESKAREDADGGVNSYSPPDMPCNTYWDSVMLEMRKAVYLSQFHRRILRNRRKAELAESNS